MARLRNTLDALLPPLLAEGNELHRNAAVLEVADAWLMAELAADPKIRRFLLARLSDTVALVDPGRCQEIETALLHAGHTPKRVSGLTESPGVGDQRRNQPALRGATRLKNSNKPSVKLSHVLSRSSEVKLDLERYNADELKRAARFWVGKEANKFRKAQSIAALKRIRPSAGKQLAMSLSDKQRKVLSIFARYGPAVSGSILSAEVRARGLIEQENKARPPVRYGQPRDMIHDLREKMILICGDPYYYSSYSDRCYPTLLLHPGITRAVAPAEPLTWQPSAECQQVKESFQRFPSEVAMDLWRVAEGMAQMGGWKTVKGNALAKASRNRLGKLVALESAETDPLAPPEPQSLYYELLSAMGMLGPDDDSVQLESLEQHLQQPAARGAWQWVRAWVTMRLWQDGVGVVPDRDNDYEPVRIEPQALRKAREMLVWALCRVAHAPDQWLDLETFLKDLWQALHEDGIRFYWHQYTWRPHYEMARTKNDFPAGAQRSLAYWLDGEGVWTSNAIMVTLVTLGLVERGWTVGKAKRPCFHLTDLGRSVFGAPEADIVEPAHDATFLTVQPDMEVLVFLDKADAGEVCMLARFAQRTSKTGGRAQTFRLSRESVYQALESGMTLDQITSFLADHGKADLPDNVVRNLSEWAGRRESLVLRTGVTLTVGRIPDGHTIARTLGDKMALLPKISRPKAVKDFANWTVLDHQDDLPKTWSADELGKLHTTGGCSICNARLSCAIDRTSDGWQMTGKSIRRAAQLGISAAQIVDWLKDHMTHGVPPLLEMAIANWCGRASAFCGQVHLLQVSQPQARDAILHSPSFAPLLVDHVPPDWFLVRNDYVRQVQRLLKQLGFSILNKHSAPLLDDMAKRPSAVKIVRKVPLRPARRRSSSRQR